LRAGGGLCGHVGISLNWGRTERRKNTNRWRRDYYGLSALLSDKKFS
jgi:hypothetical protein